MIHRVISLKYRPQNFDELTGQKHIVISLKGALKSGRIGHAFLFAGPRGVGKTTTARILAKSLNCEKGPTIDPCQKCQSCKEITLSRNIDVVEIDGASNRGIDEIRNLREGVKYSALHGRYKIYIIDEVHMLTQEAFNALLKTLEEPPSKVIFIFATTNPMKVPATILSRCQRFTFKRLSVKEISTRLRQIAGQENIKITEKALHYLSVRADGSIRDGESILEQLVSFVEGEIKEDDIFKLIGFLGSTFYLRILQEILSGNIKQVLLLINKGIEDGADPIEIYRGFTSYLRAAFLLQADMPGDYVELNSDEIKSLAEIKINNKQLVTMLNICLHYEDIVRRSVNVRIAIELLFSQLIMNTDNVEPPAQTNGGISNKTKPDSVSSIKEQLCARLRNDSPKLAGIIQDADFEQNGNAITLAVKNDFSKRQLQQNKKKLSEILSKLIKDDCSLRIGAAEPKKEKDNLAETIRALFDGEEVR